MAYKHRGVSAAAWGQEEIDVKKPETLPAPADLGEYGRKMWEQICTIWTFDDEPDNLIVLETACRAWERYQQCEREVRDKGLLVLNRYNRHVPNPILDVQRRAHNQLLAALRQIGIEYPIETPVRRRPGRPPKGK